MEHKLILGGEQYLPFARSRIRALRALGLVHASQQFEVDGVSIKVRIDGMHEYIRLEGGTDALRMDSGLVDIGGGRVEAPGGANEFALHQTGRYADNFTPTAPPGPWLVNPGAGSTGQFAGVLTYKKKAFSGKLSSYGDARSFAFRKVKDEATSLYHSDYSDTGPTAKAAIALSCPASIFTGKCRLYVQAMYGQFMYGDDKLSSLGITGAGAAVPYHYYAVDASSGTPSIRVGIYETSAEATARQAAGGQDTVPLTTSCGVYFDEPTATHWLIDPGTSGLGAARYPLRGSALAEGMRKYLKDSTLSALDREHLEAFILSTCRPHAALKTTYPLVNGAAGAFQLGYGWHWNWSGTKAAVVVLSQDSFGTMNSRLEEIEVTVAHDDGGNISSFQVANATPTDTVPWSIDRAHWCIAYPEWESPGAFVKATPKYAGPTQCGPAPFYVYFNRDEMQLCTIGVSEISVDPVTSTAVPEHFGSTPDTEYTVGMEGGYREGQADGASSIYHGKYYSCTIQLGATVVSDMRVGYLRVGSRAEIKNKVENSFAPGFYTISGGVVDIGYPIGDWVDGNPPTGHNTQYFPNRRAIYGQLANIGYDYEVSTVTNERKDLATVVIPWNDAEAVFLHATRQNLRSQTGISSTPWQKLLTSWVEATQIENWDTDPSTGAVLNYTISDHIRNYRWSAHGSSVSDAIVGSSVSVPDRTTLSVLSDVNILKCNAGEVSASFPPVSITEFHDNTLEEVIAPVFKATSGTSTDSPVVVSHTTLPQGTNGTDAYLPVLVGWV